jgi:hypothetical protein
MRQTAKLKSGVLALPGVLLPAQPRKTQIKSGTVARDDTCLGSA